MTEVPRVLLHNRTTEPMEGWFKEAFPEVACRTCDSYEALPDALSSFQPEVVYSVRFAGTPAYPREALFGQGGPRWIANGGAGTDHLGIWDPNRTVVTNAAGVAAHMMAEYVMGCFLHFTLDIPGLHQDKLNRAWNARSVRPLAGKTLLIVGLGHTGSAISARAKAFGMQVIGTRARPVPMEHVDEVYAADALDEILPQADFVAVCTPLIPATRRLLSAERIAKLAPGVIFADVSRGGVVDQAALASALQSGHVAAAALDVFETEPLPPDSPFWQLPNVIVSPHCSSVFDGWEEASFRFFLTNFERWMAKEELLNVVNPDRGY